MTCPAGLAAAGSGCAVAPYCPSGTQITDQGYCAAPPQSAAPPPPPPAKPARPGTMEITPSIVAAGSPIAASGAGCAPNHTVVLRSGGEQVGQALTDAEGRFTTSVLFSTFTAGAHTITASCGRQLTTTLDMTLDSASSGVSGSYVVLMFFLVAAFLVVRWQLSPSRR
jgi:hypothetical protein